MLKAIEQLVTGERTHVGNHRVESFNERGQTIDNYIYHCTVICTVNENERTFKTSNGGWGTSSTTRAINDYRKWFKDRDFSEVFNSEREMVEYLETIPVGRMYRCYLKNTNTQVTVTKKTLGNEKFCTVEFSYADSGNVAVHTFKYRGIKSFIEEMTEVVSK